jgi:hypothetical protein
MGFVAHAFSFVGISARLMIESRKRNGGGMNSFFRMLDFLIPFGIGVAVGLLVALVVSFDDNDCVAPAIKVPREWAKGDCVSYRVLNGQPVRSWVVLEGQYDDGAWYGKEYTIDGHSRGNSSASTSIYKKVACPEREEREPEMIKKFRADFLYFDGVRVDLRTGEVTHEGKTPKEAAKAFWKAVERSYPELLEDR